MRAVGGSGPVGISIGARSFQCRFTIQKMPSLYVPHRLLATKVGDGKEPKHLNEEDKCVHKERIAQRNLRQDAAADLRQNAATHTFRSIRPTFAASGEGSERMPRAEANTSFNGILFCYSLGSNSAQQQGFRNESRTSHSRTNRWSVQSEHLPELRDEEQSTAIPNQLLKRIRRRAFSTMRTDGANRAYNMHEQSSKHRTMYCNRSCNRPLEHAVKAVGRRGASRGGEKRGVSIARTCARSRAMGGSAPRIEARRSTGRRCSLHVLSAYHEQHQHFSNIRAHRSASRRCSGRCRSSLTGYKRHEPIRTLLLHCKSGQRSLVARPLFMNAEEVHWHTPDAVHTPLRLIQLQLIMISRVLKDRGTRSTHQGRAWRHSRGRPTGGRKRTRHLARRCRGCCRCRRPPTEIIIAYRCIL
jgi:hypothetical protein